MTKLLICATSGCETEFERRSPRHLYCDACATKRKYDYNKVWYETVGAEWKRINYLEREEVLLAEQIKNMTKEEHVKHLNKLCRAGIVQARRERRIREAEEGGRSVARRDAPVSYPYLTGIAKYKSKRIK